MKLLFSVLALLTLNKECEQNKTSVMSDAVNTEKIADTTQNISAISYEASTRGFYERVWITKDSITITTDRDHVNKMTYTTLENDWNDLMQLLKDVNIEAMPELESPTAMRHYDGAPFASLFVTQGDTETQSNSFDHGHPPKAIEAVVNKVLSIKAKHEKN